MDFDKWYDENFDSSQLSDDIKEYYNKISISVTKKDFDMHGYQNGYYKRPIITICKNIKNDLCESLKYCSLHINSVNFTNENGSYDYISHILYNYAGFCSGWMYLVRNLVLLFHIIFIYLFLYEKKINKLETENKNILDRILLLEQRLNIREEELQTKIKFVNKLELEYEHTLYLTAILFIFLLIILL